MRPRYTTKGSKRGRRNGGVLSDRRAGRKQADDKTARIFEVRTRREVSRVEHQGRRLYQGGR
jgi:hypothetical protein